MVIPKYMQIIIYNLKDANATPYISKYIVDEDTFNVTDAMTSAAPFYYKVRDTFPLGSYDVSLTLTR